MIETVSNEYPVIIQGGMGVGVSDWRLARAVALAGRELNIPVLGVVSGTGVEILLTRRLQDGDTGGHMQRALAAFPYADISEQILDKYLRNVKKPSSSRYAPTPKPTDILSSNPEKRREALALSIAANFVEVWLAKEGHNQPIGINHLEKIQILHLPRLYGAMLAGVDFVLEGAGIPNQVPGILDKFAEGLPASYLIDVHGGDKIETHFDPQEITSGSAAPKLRRPKFLAIIASNLLAKILATRASGYVDGFIIEGPAAGGHNAPPRGKYPINDRGEPVYGEKDVVNLAEIAQLGRPWWVAGSQNSPEKLRIARKLGAVGIQVGSICGLAEESGMRLNLKKEIIRHAFNGTLDVLTSTTASPTKFPFKVAQLEGTLSEDAIYSNRIRRCTLGHLLEAYRTQDGKINFLCSAAPGGDGKITICLCNGLVATAGYPQLDKLGEEPAVVTLGDDVSFIRHLIDNENGTYIVKEALQYLLQDHLQVLG